MKICGKCGMYSRKHLICVYVVKWHLHVKTIAFLRWVNIFLLKIIELRDETGFIRSFFLSSCNEIILGNCTMSELSEWLSAVSYPCHFFFFP